ncbi:putative MFS family arabinose efflux permease [Streptomonospora salina]|uniref:Putative MFS family arabinose efflux permease n=1 Tax=Streptomonospora salina TaxID=104205 RepID=A0A841EGA4_9ACTN|nr:putative MFS family arabinose efflux permease [Streptomonospora salina]
MGVVAAGLTASLFVGVPVGSSLGAAFGWRSTFVAVALATCAVAAAGALLLPRLPGAPEIGVREQLRILSRPAVLTCVLGTVLGAGGGMLTYTYIGPISHDLSGQSGWILAGFIGVVGAAGAVGTFVGGRLTDRWGADAALLATFGLLVAATLGLAAIGLAGGGSAPVWLVAAALAVYGFAGWGFNPPMNTRALRLAGDAGTEAVALNTSGLYAGIAVAGALGGSAVAPSRCGSDGAHRTVVPLRSQPTARHGLGGHRAKRPWTAVPSLRISRCPRRYRSPWRGSRSIRPTSAKPASPASRARSSTGHR